MSNFLMFIAALLVLAISALFSAPLFVDWNDYRDVFERQASRLVGREVNVGGDVSLTFLPKPVLRFENINVADEQGGFDAPFLSARSLTVWLAVPPLLRGVVEARDVALDEPILNLRVGDDGKGNWRDVGRPDVSLPFMPREVALDSFRIIDATVMVSRGNEPPRLTLDHLDGELSARSLKGPYKFSGVFEIAGETQQLKFSTGRQEANGTTRLKAVLVNDGGLAAYTVDGELTGFGAAPRFTGAFEARFVDPDAEPVAGEPQPGVMGPRLAPPLQIKAQVEAGLEQAKLTEIEASIHRSNKPQTVTGEMDIAYAGDVTLTGALTSRWLDLDSFAAKASGEAGTAGPLPALRRLASWLLGAAASVRSLKLDLSVEQAVLAGDLMHGVSAAIAGGDGGVTVERFSARLPGDAELSLDGELVARDGKPAFEGRARIEGRKLNRLLGWAGIETGSTVAAQEGDFSLHGAVSAAPGSLAIEQARGQLFGSRFSGAMRYSAGEPRHFDLTFKSERLDIGRLGGAWTEKLTIPALLRIGEAGDGKEDASASAPGWLDGSEARLDIDIGAVTLPGMGETALAAGVDIDGGNVSIRKLRLVSTEGLRVEASGSLTGLDATPSGSIDLTANADSTQGVQALARLFEFEGLAQADAWRLRAMTPAALTGSIHSAGGGRRGLSAEVKGTLGGNELSLTASLGGRLATWKDATIALDGRIKAGSARKLLAQLSSGVQKQDLALFDDDAGILSFTASGVPADGLESSLDFSGGGIAFALDGTLTARAEEFGFSGDAKLDARNAAALLTLAGAHLSPSHSAVSLELEADINSSGRLIEIAKFSGTAGDAAITGSGKLDLAAARPRVDLALEASSASLPFLFEPLIGWNARSANAPATVRGVTRSEAFWPDEPIDAELLRSFDGSLKLTAKSIRVAGPLTLTDAKLGAKLQDGTLEIERIQGKLLGGSVAGGAKFIARAGGLDFEAGAGARGLQLGKVIGGEGLASGRMDVELEVKAQGLSARGIAAGLAGKGRLTFGEGRIARLEPQTPKKAAAGLSGKDAPDEDRLVASIRRELAKGSFPFRPFEAAINVRNGVARMEKVKLENAEGRALVTTFFEFATLKIDSEWLLVSGKAEDEAAPRITLAFAGPLAQLGEIMPDIDAGALRRHATIRRMERDVERLENLEIPGAPRKRDTKKEKKEGTPSAAVTPAPQQPRVEAAKKAPVTVRRPEPPAPVSERRAPAEPSGDAVVSRPLPPAAPVQRTPDPVPSPPPQQPAPRQPAQLPWQAWRQPAPSVPVPPPATEPAREREPWDPFGL